MEHARLGHLQHQVSRIEAGLPHRPLDVRGERRLLELARRNVDAHPEGVITRQVAAPRHGLPAGLREHERTEGVDRAGLFGQVDELVGRDQATCWVPPAHERLHPHHPAGTEVHDRLVVNEELASAEAA